MLAALKHRYADLHDFLSKTDIMRWIISTLRKQSTSADGYIVKCIAIILLSTILAAIGNELFFHYHTLIFGANDIAILMGPAILWGLALMLHQKYPLSSSCILSISFAALYWIAMGIGCASLLATPFSHNLIDPYLLAFDQWLGFPQISLMNLLNANTHITALLIGAYNSWPIQTVSVVLLFGLLGQSTVTRLWLLSALISLLIGGFLYYCLPSLPPAAHLVSGYFQINSYQLIDRFYQIHLGLPYVMRGSDGLIAFPSFHITQATINTLLLWRCYRQSSQCQWLLLLASILLTALNIVLLASTLGLGFHYMADVLAGMGLATLSIYLAKQLSGITHSKARASES